MATQTDAPTSTPTCTPAVQEAQIALVEGWNLVSLPLVPADPAVGQVLASIAGSYDAVYAYDAAGTTHPWRKYCVSAPPFLSDLTSVSPSQGLWIHARRAATLTVSGLPLQPPAIALRTGWNLVGYPSQATQPVAVALASIAESFDWVYAYDPADAVQPWRGYQAGVPGLPGSLQAMRPGMGYWIRATRDCVWMVGG